MGRRDGRLRRLRRGMSRAMVMLAAMVGLGQPALAASRSGVTVVELFTSQGCSSCPPANANAASLADRPDLLVLSFGVTYWDYLGWKDIFARPEFTQRQRTYEPALGHDGPFTPQIVVDGSRDTVGNDRAALDALIAARPPAEGPDILLGGDRVTIGAGKAAAADIWLVRYDPRVVEVAVGRGENGGRTLPHRNVVHELARIGTWDGAARDIAVPRGPAGLRTAVLVQARQGGPILAAATD